MEGKDIRPEAITGNTCYLSRTLRFDASAEFTTGRERNPINGDD